MSSPIPQTDVEIIDTSGGAMHVGRRVLINGVEVALAFEGSYSVSAEAGEALRVELVILPTTLRFTHEEDLQ